MLEQKPLNYRRGCLLITSFTNALMCFVVNFVDRFSETKLSEKTCENIAMITQMQDCNIPCSTVLIADVLGNQNRSHVSSFIQQEHDARKKIMEVLGRNT